MKTELMLGHINLAETFNGAGEHFVRLIESLRQHGFDQYVIVRNTELAKRLDIVEGITVGPCVRSPVTAHCLMPRVDVVHLHDRSSWQAGLLQILTRSIPFVVTSNDSISDSRNPVIAAVRNRAAALIDPHAADIAAHIQIYRQAASSLRVPTLLL